jgi:glutamyl-tRNA synthetase/glutamyl-Q tRNA(Asp) synthetase
VARAVRGRVLLRIEDHDRQRSRAEYEAALLEDLEWLGFVPDEPPLDELRSGPCLGRQRDREPIYQAALARLSEAGLVYACACTRRDLRNGSEIEPGSGSEIRYTGRCAGAALEWTPGVALRVRLSESVERFDDLRHGPQHQEPWQQCGDMLLRDRHGQWTYQFAAAVDDTEQGVTLVIRGDDLLSSTGRQIQLARLLGRRQPPRFLHHPLIMKSATQKLSKADADTSVRDMRALGASPDEVIGRALQAAGFSATDRPAARADAEWLVAERYRSILDGLDQ